MNTENNISKYSNLNETELLNINGGSWSVVALIAAALVATEQLGESAGRALYYAIN